METPQLRNCVLLTLAEYRQRFALVCNENTDSGSMKRAAFLDLKRSASFPEPCSLITSMELQYTLDTFLITQYLDVIHLPSSILIIIIINIWMLCADFLGY